MQTTVS